MDISDKAKLPFIASIWRREAEAEDGSEIVREVTHLFDVHRRPLFRYLRSLGLAQPECEEVVQETFLSLFLHLRAGKPKTNLNGWIFRVAHNLGLKRRALGAREFTLRFEDVAELLLDVEPDAEERIATAQRSTRLRSVVAALSEQERQCLFLRAEGLRYREISETVGISLGSVAALLTRALDKLRRADTAG